MSFDGDTMPQITVAQPTVLKRYPKLSSELEPQDKMMLDAGRVFHITNHEPAQGNHVYVTFAPNAGWQNGYFFVPHLEGMTIEGNIPDNQPNDQPEEKSGDKGKLLKIPGIGDVYANDPILGQGGNFFYYEAFRPDGSRIPSSKALALDVRRGADMLEQIRERLECPMIVTSWHRPLSVNKAVGGASRSQHVSTCSAVDFKPVGMSVSDAYKKLEGWWGSRGGLAYKPGQFIHADLRGYSARWVY